MTVARSIITTTAHFQAGTETRDDDEASALMKSDHRKTVQLSREGIRIENKELRIATR
jgi:hypothetical protein